MTPELKQALMAIRDECKKHEDCKTGCPLYNPGDNWFYGYCRIMEGFTPEDVDFDEWEKENEK